MTITKKLFVSAFVLAFALVASKASAAYVHTVTLKQGSSGSQVMALQQTLNMTSCALSAGAGSAGMETTTFGPKTKVAVMCFQASHGLGADGVVGPKTGYALSVVTGTPSNPSTPCPVGYTCTPAGGSSTPSDSSLSGGAGSIDVTKTSSDVEDTVKEGEDNVKVAGIKVEAQDSDIKLTNIKVSLANFSSNGSDRLDHYVDSVSIWMGDTKVGSADVEDFSRDSGTPDTYTTTISLSGAIVREDDKENFYVAVDAVSAIDSDSTASDNDRGADVTVGIDSIRYTDATGAILTEGSGTGEIDTAPTPDTFDDTVVSTETFGFEEEGVDDDLSLKTSSANPEDMSVQVDQDSSSDEFLALAYKLEVDEDSSDIDVTTLPVHLVVTSGGTDADDMDNVVDSVTVKVGSDEWEADLDSETGSNGSLTGDYTVDLDEGDLSINAGDDVEVKVYIKFQDQDGNYAEGTKVTASVVGSAIEASGTDDDVDVSGTKEGADLTLLSSGASFSATSVAEQTTGDDDDTATFTFKIAASAFDDDIFIPKTGANAVTFDVINASTGVDYNGGTQTVSVTAPGADSDTVNSEATFVVSDDQDLTVTVVLSNNGATAGQYYAIIHTIKFYADDSDSSTTSVTVDADDFQSDPISVGV